MSDAFYGIDRSAAPSSWQFVADPFTAATLRQAMQDLLNAPPPDPRIELHHPECPKWVTQGKRACRCGTCPVEAAIEDERTRAPEPAPTSVGGDEA